MNVCKRFIEGLKDHNLTHEDIKSWQYIGGVGGRGSHKNYFNLKFKDEKHTFTPPDEKKATAFAKPLSVSSVG